MSNFVTVLEIATRESEDTPVVYLYVNRNADLVASTGKAVRIDFEAEDNDVSAYLTRDVATALARALLAAADTPQDAE